MILANLADSERRKKESKRAAVESSRCRRVDGFIVLAEREMKLVIILQNALINLMLLDEHVVKYLK
jgi:DNA-binding LacI/PurR family transcriptional regulator